MEQVETGMSTEEEYCIFCVHLEALQRGVALLCYNSNPGCLTRLSFMLFSNSHQGFLKGFISLFEEYAN